VAWIRLKTDSGLLIRIYGLLHIDTQDPDLIQRLIILISLHTFDHGADIHSLGDSPKDSMLVV
jgi:hypothetical protein